QSIKAMRAELMKEFEDIRTRLPTTTSATSSDDVKQKTAVKSLGTIGAGQANVSTFIIGEAEQMGLNDTGAVKNHMNSDYYNTLPPDIKRHSQYTKVYNMVVTLA